MASGGADPLRWLLLFVAIVVGLLIAAPFLLLLLNSLKTGGRLFAGRAPRVPDLHLLRRLGGRYIADVNYPNVLLNSVIISGLVAVLGVVVALLAAYGLGIGRVKGNAGAWSASCCCARCCRRKRCCIRSTTAPERSG